MVSRGVGMCDIVALFFCLDFFAYHIRKKSNLLNKIWTNKKKSIRIALC